MVTKPKATRMQPSDRRAGLLRSAAELFEAQGYDATGIDAVAAHAGVTGPAVYRYFSSKRELLMTLLSDAVEAALADITRVMDTSADPGANLEALVGEIVRHAIAERTVLGLLSAHTGALSPEDRLRIDELRSAIVEILATALVAVRPHVTPADATLFAQAALSLTATISRRTRPDDGAMVEPLYVRMMLGLLLA